ncbi:MAG TPA: CHAT domain-containing protein [Pyrinomonadaceae bacterium]|nr:CHAT domain-containing protein [Pyrinomonadaceae bacterium]
MANKAVKGKRAAPAKPLTLARVKKSPARAARTRKPTLRVVVTHGSITDVPAPVVVVGAYKGIAPTERSALGAIDLALNEWISRACNHGLMGLDLGQVFFIPVTPQQMRAQSALLAGMGDYGVFDYSDLCYLSMNVCYAVSALKQGSLATVLIGSGEGNLSIPDAVKGLLSGICDALHHVRPEERIKTLEIVEFSQDRHKVILESARQIAADKIIPHISLSVEKGKSYRVKKASRSPRKTTAALARAEKAKPFVNRITIEHNSDGYNFAALTENAVVPVRQIDVKKYFTDGITKQLKISDTAERREQFGSLLHRYVFPQDFEQLIGNSQPLTLVVDNTTAVLPWEMACFGAKHRLTYFGRDLKLTRQFRTMLAGAPGIAPPLNRNLRVLVIADPAPEPELQLKGAKTEGQKVVEMLRKFEAKKSGDPNWKITIEDRIGYERCDPVEILELIVNGSFDIIHYSGHGVFDEDHPNNGGWVFGKDTILSATEIFRLRQVPRLVFANACFSAVLNNNVSFSPRESNRKLAGLAEAFFERGVQNYIGTGWEVGDDAAETFAEVFYGRALEGDYLGDALSAARTAIFSAGPTWGAYQHYGQSNARVVLRDSD